MFTLDNSVPDTNLLKKGTYSAILNKAEQATSNAGAPMLKLEYTIPVSEVQEQGFSNPFKVFDIVMLNHSAQMCKVKEKQFVRAFGLDGKDFAYLQSLVGKAVKATLNPKTDEYGEKMEVRGYTPDSLHDAPNAQAIPF